MSEPLRKGPQVMVTVTYCAANGSGVVSKTFGDLDHAREWVRTHAHKHHGLHVQEVTQTTVRRKVFQPRSSLRLVSQ